MDLQEVGCGVWTGSSWLTSFHFCVRGIIFNSITLVRGFRWGGPREGHLEDPGVDERIILRWISMKWVVGYGLDRAG